MFLTLNLVNSGSRNASTIPLVLNVIGISSIWPYNMGTPTTTTTMARTSVQMSNGSSWNVTETMEEITAKLMMI